MSRRALLIIDSLQVGGAQQMLLHTARQLSARGWALEVICLHYDKPNAISEGLEALPGMKMFRLSSGFYSLKAVWQIRGEICRFHPDVVETHLLRGNTAGLLAAKIAGIPTVAVMHAGGFGKEHKHKSYNTTETFMVRHFADRIIAVGTLVRTFQQQRFPGRSIEILSNSIPIPPEGWSIEKRREARGLLNLDETIPLAMAVGRMSAQKAYPDLFSAFQIVREKLPQAQLIIFGGGTLLEEMRSRVVEMGMEDEIRLPGVAADPSKYLSGADVYVLSSSSEGLPMAMLEAMAAGLPVVVTRVGEVPAIVDASCGILLEAGDVNGLAKGMLHYLQNPQAARRDGAAGREIVKARYNLESWTDQLIAIFQSVMKGQKSQ